MTKGRDLPSYIHRRPRDGILLFRKRYGKRIVEIKLETQFPEGAQVPFALHQEREQLLNAPAPVATGKDIAAVLRHYIASPNYRELKPRTRQDYDKHLDYFRETLGSLAPKNIERPHVLTWRNAWAEKHTAHFANYRTRVLSIVLEHAKDMGLLTKGDENPAKGIRALKYEKQDRQPWPETKVTAFRKAFPYGTRERTLFELLLGTGQRIGDVLLMQWNHIEDDVVRVSQNKTGKPMWIPVTTHLREALNAAERQSLFILSKDMSKTKRPGPWAYRGAADAMRVARTAIGAKDYDLHALRYTAAAELLLAGCDDDQIAAITGQSKRMVEHYTRHVRQRARATEAQHMRNVVSPLANRTEHK